MIKKIIQDLKATTISAYAWLLGLFCTETEEEEQYQDYRFL